MEYETPLFFHVMAYAAEADRDVIDMVSGTPDWDPPAAIREGLHEYADGTPAEFQYSPSEGMRSLREEIAARRDVETERVVVTNGAGEANYLGMAAALERGAGTDFVLTDPVYPYYPSKARMLGGTVTQVPVDADGSLDVPAMTDAITDETAAVVVNTPNNPTGAVYDPGDVRHLAEVAADHDALLVADEVYDHFDFTGRFESALTFEADNVVVTNAYSKAMAITGLRVGYAVLPDDLVAGAKTRHMLVNVAANRPGQAAVLRALAETPPEYYEATRERLRDRASAFTDALDDAGATYLEPEGAFYVLARLPAFPGTLDNVTTLIDEAGVAGMPGEAFGEARTEWMRFALVTPDVEAAARRLGDFFA